VSDLVGPPSSRSKFMGPEPCALCRRQPRQARKGATARGPTQVPQVHLGPISPDTAPGQGLEVGMYQVLARKWRPQTLDELIGQPHIARTLMNAVAGGRLAHAYVFAGLRGTGKTSVARILAKCLNCEKGPIASPCNQCLSCREIVEGRSLDVMELDAASRTGVDNIRELQEVVSYAPVRDRYRVLIIDEAHMLSKPAFNALLKTLEEPPPRVVFVLATTEIQKLLPTILSRCQVFEFHRVSIKNIAAHLRRIAAAEGLVVSDRTLERVARAGEGSVRDALSVLERVLAFCGPTIADEDALQVLGAVRTEVLVEFVRGIASRDAAALLSSLDALVDQGHDLVHFWGELVGVVRDLMLLRAWPQGGDALSRPPDEAAALIEAGGALSLQDWTRVFQILAGLEYGLKGSSQPRFLFEGALIRIAGLGAVRPIEEILATLGGASANPPATPGKKVGAGAANQASTSPIAAGFADVREAIVSAVTQARPMLGAVLERAATLLVDGGTLVATFGPSDAGMRRMLTGDETVRSIETIAAQALGRPLTLRVLGLGEGAGVGSPEALPGEAGEGEARDGIGESQHDLAQRARKDPAVSRLLTEFGAQVVDVRPLHPGVDEAAKSFAVEEGG
jgi:DNA polymerase III subunit gamma/tau